MSVWLAISLVLNGAFVGTLVSLLRHRSSERQVTKPATVRSSTVVMKRKMAREPVSSPNDASTVVLQVPENPSLEQVHAAIYDLEMSLLGRDSITSNQLELSSLDRMPLEMLPEVIEHPLDSLAGYFVVEAVKHRLTPDHKTIVLEAFARTGAFADLILQYGWAQDCADPILRLVGDRRAHRLMGNFERYSAILTRLDSEEVWQAVCEFLEAHPDYWHALVDADSSARMQATVEVLWGRTQYHLRARLQLAPAAVSYGIAEALDFASEIIEAGKAGHEISMLIQAVYGHTTYDGPAEEFPRWYASTHERLIFDARTRKFTSADTEP